MLTPKEAKVLLAMPPYSPMECWGTVEHGL